MCQINISKFTHTWTIIIIIIIIIIITTTIINKKIGRYEIKQEETQNLKCLSSSII